MLDLNFARENLPLVEEKLRQRGMDPAAVLKDFREVDTERRQAITEAETSKAKRNKASEEIAKLKKSGQDASAAMAQILEPADRGTREDLVRAANGYLDGVARDDAGLIPAADDCVRIENGLQTVLNPDADGFPETFVSSGGLGGLGQEMARWLADRGARHIALNGRREPGEVARGVVADLRARGVDVRADTEDGGDDITSGLVIGFAGVTA